MRSLCLQTDLLVQRGRTIVEDRGDHAVLRTPAEPHFWYGNALVLRSPPDKKQTAPHLIAQFRRDFPDCRHVCLQWDVPDMVLPTALESAFAEDGFDIDISDTLVLQGDLTGPDLPAGLVVRALRREEEWQASLSLAVEIAVEEGMSPAAYRAFRAPQLDLVRQQIAQGQGQCFGVFDGDTLVAQMGVFHDDTLIRYQNVETRKSYRRRGICAALLVLVGRWALSRAVRARLVIVADTDGDAGRLYRRAGFALHERITAVACGDYGRRDAVT